MNVKKKDLIATGVSYERSTLNLKFCEHLITFTVGETSSVGKKTCKPNFSVTDDLPDKSRERSPYLFVNSAELRSRQFSKRPIVAEKFRIAGVVLALSHPYTFYILFKEFLIITQVKNPIYISGTGLLKFYREAAPLELSFRRIQYIYT